MRTLESISEFFVGLDLGQKRDFSAFCLVERRMEMFDAKDPGDVEFSAADAVPFAAFGTGAVGDALSGGGGTDGDDDAESSAARAV